MPLLTSAMLEANTLFRHYPHIDYSSIRRAYELAQQGQVSVTDFTGETATCSVEDRGQSYVVNLSSVADAVARLVCTCSRAQKGYFCVHMAAAALATSTHISDVAQNQWRYRLQAGLERAPQQPRSRAATPYLVLYGLHAAPYGRSPLWSLDQYRISARY